MTARPVADDELELLAADVRRTYGDRFPLPRRDETAADRELREEMTRDLLENTVLADVERQRLANRQMPLADAEQQSLVELVLSEMFGLPKLLSVLRDPMVTDVLVFGADPVRVERADGTRQLLPPLVRRDRDLERIIYDTAAARRRPFNRSLDRLVDGELMVDRAERAARDRAASRHVTGGAEWRCSARGEGVGGERGEGSG